MVNPTPKDDEDPPIIIIIRKALAPAKENPASHAIVAVLAFIAGAWVF